MEVEWRKEEEEEERVAEDQLIDGWIGDEVEQEEAEERSEIDWWDRMWSCGVDSRWWNNSSKNLSESVGEDLCSMDGSSEEDRGGVSTSVVEWCEETRSKQFNFVRLSWRSTEEEKRRREVVGHFTDFSILSFRSISSLVGKSIVHLLHDFIFFFFFFFEQQWCQWLSLSSSSWSSLPRTTRRETIRREHSNQTSVDTTVLAQCQDRSHLHRFACFDHFCLLHWTESIERNGDDGGDVRWRAKKWFGVDVVWWRWSISSQKWRRRDSLPSQSDPEQWFIIFIIFRLSIDRGETNQRERISLRSMSNDLDRWRRRSSSLQPINETIWSFVFFVDLFDLFQSHLDQPTQFSVGEVRWSFVVESSGDSVRSASSVDSVCDHFVDSSSVDLSVERDELLSPHQNLLRLSPTPFSP